MFSGGGGETRNYIKTLIFAGVSMLSASGVFAEAKSVKLVCSGYTGSERLQNFQALVKLYDGCSYGFSYDDYAAKDGTDIWFTDSDGTLIPHEIDVWNPSGESFVWVKIPEIANNTTYITMHWGEARTAEQTCVATETWSNHVGVWHMNGTVVDGAPQTETDATGNGLDAVPECHPSGKATYLKNMTRASTSAVGYARVNKTTIQAYDTCGLKVPTYKDKGIVDDVTKFTLSGWFYWDGSNGKNSQTDSGDYLHLFSNQGTFTINEGNDNDQPAYDTLPKNGRFNVQKNAGSEAISASVDGGSAIKIGNGTGSGQHKWANGWVQFVFVFDGTGGKVYRNGALLAQGTMGNCIAHSAYGFAIGCKGWRKSNAFRGKYDEVRMFDGVESADRIKADYATVNSPESFLEPPSPLPATAVWTGEANDGDISNPQNWLCKNNLGIVLENKLPIASTDVTIEGTGTGLFINIAAGETLQYKTLSIGNCTLGANCDWRGLGADVMSHAAGKTIELNGYGLKVAGLTASATATIKNTATGTPADLTVDVASGETVNNRVSLTGNLKLVKDGAGWLATTIKQTYTGGTEVLQGTISPEKNTSSSSPNGGPGGIWAYGQGKILVKKNGTFDVCGQLGYRYREVVLDGGTLASGGTGQYSPENYAGSGVTEILSDSHIAVTAKRLVFGGGYDGVPLSFKYTNLNGFTLDAAIATEMTIYGFAGPTNGTFKTSGAGTLKFGAEQHIMESTSFEVGCALNMGAAITVSNYVARYTGTANAGSAALKVKYVFKPETSGFYGCTMMAGSTMDFTAWPSAADASGWPVASKFTSGTKNISFEGGTVTVKLDETREDVKTLSRKKTDGSYSGYLLKWASAPSAEFSLDPVSNVRYRLVKDASGLLLMPRPGLAVIVR